MDQITGAAGGIIMIDRQVLIREIETLPSQIIEEVYDYVSFLKTKKTQNQKVDDITLASESALAADWLLPEEDIAWASL